MIRVKLAFDASQLGTSYKGAKTTTDCIGVSIMCQSVIAGLLSMSEEDRGLEHESGNMGKICV